MTETDFRMRTKLTEYRFQRSSEKLRINLAVYPDKKIKITLCFSSENYKFASQEREFIEDLLQKDLSPDGWYLVMH